MRAENLVLFFQVPLSFSEGFALSLHCIFRSLVSKTELCLCAGLLEFPLLITQSCPTPRFLKRRTHLSQQREEKSRGSEDY